MKKALIFILTAGLLMGCELIVIDPVYDQRNRITGSYQVEEYSETGNTTLHYTMQIHKAGSGLDVYLENFYDAGIQARAEVNGDKLYIPWQMRDGYEVEGVGTIYGNRITINYSVRDTYNHSTPDFCQAEAWMQW